MKLTVRKVLSDVSARTNKIYYSKDDIHKHKCYLMLESPTKLIFSAESTNDVKKGEIGINRIIRHQCSLKEGEEITLNEFIPSEDDDILQKIILKCEHYFVHNKMMREFKKVDYKMTVEDLMEVIKGSFLRIGQFIYLHTNMPITCKVYQTVVKKEEKKKDCVFGYVDDNTEIVLIPSDRIMVKFENGPKEKNDV